MIEKIYPMLPAGGTNVPKLLRAVEQGAAPCSLLQVCDRVYCGIERSLSCGGMMVNRL